MSQFFDHWNNYVTDLFQILTDLTNALLSGNLTPYIRDVDRATSLLLLLGMTNYTIILAGLKEKFPRVYNLYMNGGIVMSTNKSVLFDQALEQRYNRHAKVNEGKKEAAAIMGIIKHKIASTMISW